MQEYYLRLGNERERLPYYIRNDSYKALDYRDKFRLGWLIVYDVWGGWLNK